MEQFKFMSMPSKESYFEKTEQGRQAISGIKEDNGNQKENRDSGQQKRSQALFSFVG